MSTFTPVKSMTRKLTEAEEKEIMDFWGDPENQSKYTLDDIIEKYEKLWNMPITKTAIQIIFVKQVLNTKKEDEDKMTAHPTQFLDWKVEDPITDELVDEIVKVLKANHAQFGKYSPKAYFIGSRIESVISYLAQTLDRFAPGYDGTETYLEFIERTNSSTEENKFMIELASKVYAKINEKKEDEKEETKKEETI